MYRTICYDLLRSDKGTTKRTYMYVAANRCVWSRPAWKPLATLIAACRARVLGSIWTLHRFDANRPSCVLVLRICVRVWTMYVETMSCALVCDLNYQNTILCKQDTRRGHSCDAELHPPQILLVHYC